MIPPWILIVGIIALVLGVAYGVRNQINGLLGYGGAATTTGATRIWWYVDDSQVNAREWLDWGARSTREPNEPYLQICKERATRLWGDSFQIEPVLGRVDALTKLRAGGCSIPDGANRAPPALWMPWCRAAFLSTYGGLWLDGSVLPLASGAELRERVASANVLTFGSDPDEGLSSAEEGLPAAGRAAGWASMPGHPMWSGLAHDLAALIAAGDQSWSAPEARRSLRSLWDKHCSGVTRVDRGAEVSRDRYGRRLELDTLLGETDWPTGTREGGLWVPLPDGRDGLERASPWLWFTRMSKAQIQESQFLWAQWARAI